MRTSRIASSSTEGSQHGRWFDVAAVALIVLMVASIYGARLGRQPIVGEESRWATGAREMLATGDFVVPRQQGRVFPERPPATMWAMAALGWLRGDVDPVAIRFPSVTAVLLTSLLIYWYARTLAAPIAALIAALVYPTFGQVLQIGRLGESEALFALLVSASLLIWHLGYLRGWTPLATWSIGFGCAALAALVKGPQAPVYFVAITGVYLIICRDWRYFARWQYAAGACVFAVVVAAWQVPFYFETDWPSVVATWSGLAADRIHLRGIANHVVTYPVETFACLLPWSPLLVALAKRETRNLFAPHRSVTTFLFTAIVVAYPTVWLATGARGRYFMPLYPLVALLVGLLVERISQAMPGTYPRRAWHQFLLLSSALIGVGGLVLGLGTLPPIAQVASLHQPPWFCLLFSAVAAAAMLMIWKVYRDPRRFPPWLAVATIATIVGIAYTGAVININVARWNDPQHSVAQFRRLLPAHARLVSLTPIEHRFAYYYREAIPELDWPARCNDLPPNVEYFCFMRQAGDSAASRAAGRGRTWTTSPGTLPFAWEEITSICVERRLAKAGNPTVVLGRVVRPIRPAVTDATVRQSSTAERTGDKQRR
jgi:4-amino-4-deoxy-L-arabinose transferase-like glycosyltransferase